MQLKEFSFISPVVEAALVFKAIETVISPEIITESLAKTNSMEDRKRKLPSSLVVCLVIAMSLWGSDSMGTVLKNLVNGLSRQWTKLGQYWRVPNSASITEARQRLGCRVMSQLFEQIVGYKANPQTPGAFLGGLRVMAVDGTVLDVPDSQANARVFGYPASRPGTSSAFPRIAFSDVSRSRNSFDSRCLNVSLSNWRASAGIKTATLGCRRNATDVGQRIAFLCDGTRHTDNWLSLLGAGAEKREI